MSSVKQNTNLITIPDVKVTNEIREKVRDKILTARSQLLIHFPFFGMIIMGIEAKEADEQIPTMAVDGKHLYYNNNFVMKLTLDECIFVLAHETLHVVYGHIWRCDDRIVELFNVAADYVINGELIKLNVGHFPDSCTNVQGLHDTKFDGWSTEEVYDYLLKQQKKSGWDKELKKLVSKLIDEHFNGQSAPDKGNGEKKGSGNSNGLPKLSPDELATLKAQICGRLLSAAQGSGIGNCPLGVQRLVNEFVNPKISWKELLPVKLQGILPSDYSFMKLNRNGWHMDAVLPGMVNDPLLKIEVWIDTSGSISQQNVTEFLSEVQGIMQQYRNYEIGIGCWDTKTYNHVTFSTNNGDDVTSYEIMGGGGTDASCVFEYMKENSINPLQLIMFTDGYVSKWGDENYCPTLWIINNSERVEPPFGAVAYYKEV